MIQICRWMCGLGGRAIMLVNGLLWFRFSLVGGHMHTAGSLLCYIPHSTRTEADDMMRLIRLAMRMISSLHKSNPYLLSISRLGASAHNNFSCKSLGLAQKWLSAVQFEPHNSLNTLN